MVASVIVATKTNRDDDLMLQQERELQQLDYDIQRKQSEIRELEMEIDAIDGGDIGGKEDPLIDVDEPVV